MRPFLSFLGKRGEPGKEGKKETEGKKKEGKNATTCFFSSGEGKKGKASLAFLRPSKNRGGKREKILKGGKSRSRSPSKYTEEEGREERKKGESSPHLFHSISYHSPMEGRRGSMGGGKKKGEERRRVARRTYFFFSIRLSG